jgi:anaerobic magnesium-protoporphyrin IX monomethyl ester cyclase
MNVLLIQTPRRIWPVIDEYDMQIPPLNLLSLAAVLEQHDINVEIIDCVGIRKGWKTLEKMIRQKNPDIVGSGEMTCFAHEVLRALKISKEIDNECITVAGGKHFSFLSEEILKENPFVDYIVRGEGEYKFLELVKALEKDKNPKLSKIKGIAFRDKNTKKIIITPPRPPIVDLDELPIPAYHLVDMNLYGTGKMWHKSTTIEASRGCAGSCNFCTEWNFFGKWELVNGKEIRRPFWRTKSPKRFVDEIELLHNKYGRRHFWVADDNYNLDQKRNIAIHNDIHERGLDNIRLFTFSVAGGIVRDEADGVLKDMVRSGLTEVFIGIESGSQEHLNHLGKSTKLQTTAKAYKILREKYPQVMRHGIVVIGHRKDTRKSILNTLKFVNKFDLDNLFVSILSPLPGSKYYEKARKNGWIKDYDYMRYDFLNAVMPTETLTIRQIETLRDFCYFMFYMRPIRFFRKGLSEDWTRQQTYRTEMKMGFKLVFKQAILPLFSRKFPRMDQYIPDWYES